MKKTNPPGWKFVEEADAAVCFWLTGESVIKAVTDPSPPSSKSPTIVRFTHSNTYGPVAADIFVRLGDPKHPLGADDFDSVSDWRPAKLVEDLTWDADNDTWQARGNSSGEGTEWNGTFEVRIQFPKGKSQIEIKVISQDSAVCSIVLSNWTVNAR